VTEPSHSSILTGWREWVSLPELGVSHIKAKIDTGAQTSALHAEDIEPFTREGAPWVRFTVHPWQHNDLDPVRIEAPVHDRRVVRSSSGHAQERFVVLSDVELSGRRITAEFTLTSRHEMVFRMLIGREALRQGFLVDPASSYLGGKPEAKIRRRNRAPRDTPQD